MPESEDDNPLLNSLKRDKNIIPSKGKIVVKNKSLTDKRSSNIKTSSEKYSTHTSNNYMNITYSPRNQWLGMTGVNGRFVVFSDPIYSVRAYYKTILSYTKQGADTIEKVIYKYAPPNENNTSHYLSDVVAHLAKEIPGVTKETKVTKEMLPHLAQIMMIKESGIEKPISWFNNVMSMI